jgi:AbiV family abortive infection protein
MKRPHLDAVRLFKDACAMYVARAYPTAFALGVLAYEEVGKAFYVQRICEHIEGNPEDANSLYEMVASGIFLKQHRGKQECALVEGTHEWKTPMAEKVRAGELNREKQQALYVELVDDQVLTPGRIAPARAYQLLGHVVEAFVTAPGYDWAFIGLDDESTPRSEWLAEEQLAIVRASFSTCAPPS